MLIKKADFLKSTTDPSQFPGYPYPEFAFFGRSNTGKSSLMQYLLGGNVFVKTSSRPGHTQTINFFVVNDCLSFADLPGFGYAKAPADIRAAFFPMITQYIASRNNLRIGFLLIDIRREPVDDEYRIVDLLTKNAIPVAIVATKSDKLSRNEIVARTGVIASSFGILSSDIYITSSLKKIGRDNLWDLIERYTKR
jgi:GTP-binding protein